MALNTTSFLAGVGSVVAVLSTGLAGGYFLANPSHIDPPNRLQRVAAANQDSKPAAPAPATMQAAQTAPQATAAPAAQPAATPSEAKASEPARTADIQETAAPAPTASPDTDAKANDAKANGEKANADKARAAEARSTDARAAEKKRAGTRKIAEQQRKQRELEVATIAVRRIIHERDPSDVVVDSDQAETPAAEMPHFNLFRQ